jgi:cell division protein FtsB
MLKSLLQPLQQLFEGATGKDRQEKRQLTQQLIKLQAEYARLQREMDDLLSYTDEETAKLSVNGENLRSQLRQIRAEKQELIERNEALESRVIFLEQQVKALQTHKNQISGAKKRSARAKKLANHLIEPAEDEPIDLSQMCLALVGGHDNMRRTVTEELSKAHGLKRWVEIPPHSVASNSRQQIKEKISNCDLVVIITNYIDHSLTNSVIKLRDAEMLTGPVIRVNCRGKSGVVRDILEYIAANILNEQSA